MNRTLKAIATILLMLVFVVSCNKPDIPNNGGDNNGPNDSIVDDNGSIDGHDYVDLGLPSGTLWAACNVGADTPEGYGDYFAWGEIVPKELYDWNTYKYGSFVNEHYEFDKYCTDSVYGHDGFVDKLTVLESGDDAATANWGADWRIPTMDEWDELFQNTTFAKAIQNGVKGWCLTASNGNSIFLPAAGYCIGGTGCSNSLVSAFIGRVRSTKNFRTVHGASTSILTVATSVAAATAVVVKQCELCGLGIDL